jgi:hypothetical protein
MINFCSMVFNLQICLKVVVLLAVLQGVMEKVELLDWVSFEYHLIDISVQSEFLPYQESTGPPKNGLVFAANISCLDAHHNQ